MDRYIGLDAHASSCTVAVVGPRERRLHPQAVETNAGALIRVPKSDKLDAFGLAEQFRIGAVKRKVYKKRGEFGALGHRAKAYTLLVSDSVRVQNRIKSLFRSRGVKSRIMCKRV
jgi:hypothetical protein